MSEIKTKSLESDVEEFLRGIEPEKKRKDSIEIKKIFDSVLSEKAVLWSNNMIGYGSYHYKSDKSSQEGDWPLTGFSPRKQNIVIYIMLGVTKYSELINKLGKVKVSSGSCLYVNKIDDINIEVLKELIKVSVSDMKTKYELK